LKSQYERGQSKMQKYEFTFDTTIIDDDPEISEQDISVSVIVYPGCPAVLNPPDRAQPEEPDEVIVTGVKYCGVDITKGLTNSQLDILEEEGHQRWEESAQDDMDSRADQAYEEKRDKDLEALWEKEHA